MTTYQLPSNRDKHLFRHPIMYGTHVKKLTGLKQLSYQPLYKDKTQSAVTFNPLEMLDIFEHGRQIKEIERHADEEIID
jgi:hypothetical protein